MNAWWMHRDDFTDRVRMEVIPELEAQVRRTKKKYRDSTVFTRDYIAGVCDGMHYTIIHLNAILDAFDAVDRALDEEDE